MSQPERKLNEDARQSRGPAVPSEASSTLPKRVLIYAMNYSPELIGCGRYTGEIGAALNDAGVKIEVVTTPPHYPGWQARDGYSGGRYTVEEVGGARISRCPLALSKDMRGIKRAIAPISFALSSAPVVMWRILKFRPTAVLCIEPTLFAAPAALLAAKMIGAKTVLHVQDLEIDAAFAVGHVKNGVLRVVTSWFERAVTCSFDQVVTISQMMAQQLLKKGISQTRLSIVRNWVDTSRIYPLKRPSIYRESLGLLDKVVVLYAGNIGPKQALHCVVDAAERLKSRKEIVFVIAGEGPEKEKLQSRGLSNVMFLPLQPEEKLNELLNLADIHVLPQAKDTADLVLPSKVGGMIASGGGIAVMAETGTELHSFLSGYAEFVEPGNDEALAATILAFGADASKGLSSRKNRSTALEALDKDKAVATLSNILSK